MSSNSNTIESLPHLNANIHTLSQPVTKKLNGTNFMAWSMQFTVFLNSHDLIGYIDGTITAPTETIEDAPNPTYAIWFRKDNCVKSWILASISEKLLLLSTEQGQPNRHGILYRPNLHLPRAKAIADQLAAVGKPMDDQDLISHILGGLKVSYTPFITSYTLSTRNVDLTLEDFQAKLFSFETLLENQQQTNANPHYAFAAHKSKMPPFHKKPQRSGQAPNYRPNRPSATPPTRAYDNGNSSPSVQQNTRHSGRPACQICCKTNHIALDCYKRFNYAYQGRIPPPDLAAMAPETNAQFDNQVWYADSGANAHITTNAENLTTQQPFEGSDMITVGNGTGLSIKNTGHSSLYLNQTPFHLNNVLHCPQASNQTYRILFQGQAEHGLYPLAGNKSFSNKVQCFAAKLGVKTTKDKWHSRLGH
ncbi:hypothetical protein Pint_21992 [Pistacia integerrima]|uniref:Uncharacterized protein n=1 Tax=Pistacia integerrima TaxID=434235 RepID=A0ACC0YLA9_9ROSI|nr:hypothetical protein Pint_21992 [Pistacia integerrima]